MVSILRKPFKKLSRLAGLSKLKREALLHHWLHSPLGQELVAEQRKCLQTVVRNKFGQHMVQLDMGLYEPLVESPPVGCYSMVSMHENRSPTPLIRADAESLPFQPESVGTFILHHSLDFSDDPYKILREVNQALVPDGVIVIVGFNPMSLWSFRKLTGWIAGRIPWTGQFFRPHRIQDWLSVLDIEIEERYSLFHRPALNKKNILDKLIWLEKLVSIMFPKLGACYVIVGRKKTLGVTPLSSKWAKEVKKKAVLEKATSPKASSSIID